MTVVWLIGIAGVLVLMYVDAAKMRWCVIFGAGILAGFLLSLVRVNVLFQLICFAVCTLAAFLLFRHTENPLAFEPVKESPGKKMVGQLGLVEKEIGRKDAGTVSVLKNTWKAKDIRKEGIPAGEYVRVKSAKGDTLFVEIAGEQSKSAETPKRRSRVEKRLHEKTGK